MRRLLLTTAAILLSALLAVPVLAVNDGSAPAPAADQAQTQPKKKDPGVSSSNVPQAQIDLMRKREEARQRRDELLKLRQQNIEALDRGNPPVDKVPADMLPQNKNAN